MEFKRVQLEKIEARLKNSPKVVGLLGARQVGKTTLINKIKENHEHSVLTINADIGQYRSILAEQNLEQIRLLVHGYDLLIIDEAQQVPKIGHLLKIIHDHLPEIQVLVTGSSALDLAQLTGEPLTGRMWRYILYPMALQELTHLGNPFEISLKLESFLIYGLYPEVFHHESHADKVEYLMTLSRAYLYKDILELSGIRNHDKIHDLLRLLAYQIGSLVSYSELGRQLGLSTETVQHYIDLLEKSFVLQRLRGFSQNLRKEITKNAKIYFLDLGVRNAVIGNFNPISSRPDIGVLWENFLVIERLKFNAYSQSHKTSYFWRTYTGAELDYVEAEGEQLNGFEFKWGKKLAKAPKSWTEVYPHAGFETINSQNFLSFLGMGTKQPQ